VAHLLLRQALPERTLPETLRLLAADLERVAAVAAAERARLLAWAAVEAAQARAEMAQEQARPLPKKPPLDPKSARPDKSSLLSQTVQPLVYQYR
jgi:cell division septum initiation protein DivIVA